MFLGHRRSTQTVPSIIGAPAQSRYALVYGRFGSEVGGNRGSFADALRCKQGTARPLNYEGGDGFEAGRDSKGEGDGWEGRERRDIFWAQAFRYLRTELPEI
jgi:hypothetical protein